MQPAEQNYKIYNKELLAIVEAITKWRQYLLNATEKFEVLMDHENLKYFQEPHKLNGRQAKWYLNYKIMISYYSIFPERQTQKLTFYQEKITSTP